MKKSSILQKNWVNYILFSFDFSAVDFLESLNVSAYKIASPELIDLPLIRYAAQKQKPIILSTGMATENEIKDAVNTVLEQITIK